MTSPLRQRQAVIKEATAAENETQSLQRQQWLRDGLCPHCGEKGEFLALGAVCSVHGPYDFQPELQRAATVEPWIGEEGDA